MPPERLAVISRTKVTFYHYALLVYEDTYRTAQRARIEARDWLIKGILPDEK